MKQEIPAYLMLVLVACGLWLHRPLPPPADSTPKPPPKNEEESPLSAAEDAALAILLAPDWQPAKLPRRLPRAVSKRKKSSKVVGRRPPQPRKLPPNSPSVPLMNPARSAPAAQDVLPAPPPLVVESIEAQWRSPRKVLKFIPWPARRGTIQFTVGALKIADGRGRTKFFALAGQLRIVGNVLHSTDQKYVFLAEDPVIWEAIQDWQVGQLLERSEQNRSRMAGLANRDGWTVKLLPERIPELVPEAMELPAAHR